MYYSAYLDLLSLFFLFVSFVITVTIYSTNRNPFTAQKINTASFSLWRIHTTWSKTVRFHFKNRKCTNVLNGKIIMYYYFSTEVIVCSGTSWNKSTVLIILVSSRYWILPRMVRWRWIWGFQHTLYFLMVFARICHVNLNTVWIQKPSVFYGPFGHNNRFPQKRHESHVWTDLNYNNRIIRIASSSLWKICKKGRCINVTY